MEFELESSPLQLRIGSAPEKMKVYLSNASGNDAGAVFIDCTSSTPRYKLHWCSDYADITETLPTTTDRTWQITKTREPLRVTIQCNGVVIANISLSDETCTKEDWVNLWSRDVKMIKFDKNYGDNTESYRAGPGTRFLFCSKLRSHQALRLKSVYKGSILFTLTRVLQFLYIHFMNHDIRAQLFQPSVTS